MRIAIMQPYFLPYIGYFQLMKSVDLFVFYDDVAYIKQGWVNRNRILLNGADYLFTLQLKKASSFKNINSIEIGNNRSMLLKTFLQTYKKAPNFINIEPLLQSVFALSQPFLAQYNIETLKLISSYIGINTKFVISSDIKKNNSLKGQEKIIEICNILGADSYVNPVGGRDLYADERFAHANIKLAFLNPPSIKYDQFDGEYVPWLSIIDVMMFNSVEAIDRMLSKGELAEDV